MNRINRQLIFLLPMLLFCAGALAGCGGPHQEENEGHEPLTIITGEIDYSGLEALIAEKYPEIRLEYISYAGSNTTGYTQYLLQNGEIPDIYSLSVFSMQKEQAKYLLDLSGYEFLNNYKTSDINQVTLDGAVYMVPASSAMIGLYYNQTMFSEHGWQVPDNFEELKALTQTIRTSGIDPVAAQFELSGNGFFDLFTLAKTDFLSTPAGLQWEHDFKDGKAAAKEGLSESVAMFQELIDCGFFDAEDAACSMDACLERFYQREAAMYLNAGIIGRFTQNEDGTGDKYGLMPFFGSGENNTVLISKPMRYYGLSKTLSEPGNEQKLADALKVMELLATEEGQRSVVGRKERYITPLKNVVIPEDSPFHEVEETIRSGHTSNLAYAGYEPIIIGVGDKVRDWVAGKCTGNDVLALMDELQTAYLDNKLPPVAVVSQDLTLEETAQLQAEAFRQAAGTDIGLISLGAYHDGVENYSGVCGKLFEGDISMETVNAIVPGKHSDPVCILTLTGAKIMDLLETGFSVSPDAAPFTYVPAGLTIAYDRDGSVEKVTLSDGSPMDETANYTVAMDQGSFTEETAREGFAVETELIVYEVVEAYLSAHSPVTAPPPFVN